MKVSLFPFLPVLLCMMGAMIMLLILIAWDVREQTISPAEAAVATQMMPLEAMTIEEAEELHRKITWQTEDAELLIENFAHAKKQAEEELADMQARLALAERETQKVKDELARLEQLAQQWDSQASVTPEEVEHLKRLLAQQQQRRAEAELELAKLRVEAARKEKSYAIVPYRGPDGTFRRPIYIECRDDKIIIQPEGIELVLGDFQALDRPDNPFATALRVIRQYYIDTDQIVRGSEPYPLFAVRPSGVEMYSHAWQTIQPRHEQATSHWVETYGYELVCEDWNIQYPVPNEELRRRLQQQLEVSRNQLSSYLIAQQMARQSTGFSGDAPRFSLNHRGEVIPVDGGLRNRDDVQRYREANRQIAGQQIGKQEANQMSLSAEMIDREEMLIRQDEARVRQMYAEQMQPIQSQQPQQPPQLQQIEQMGQQQMQNPSEQPSMQVGVTARGIPQNQRQQNWALQGATQFTTGISMTVRIRCDADRFVIPAQAGLAAEREIPIAGSVSTAADQLVQAIWEFQHSWGSAGENTHWRPILKIQVSPGGEQRLRELQTLLRNSGLVVETY